MLVNAERGESAGQIAEAIHLGVDLVQGYFVAEPRSEVADVNFDLVEPKQ